jgi:hypothetical protein
VPYAGFTCSFCFITTTITALHRFITIVTTMLHHHTFTVIATTKHHGSIGG